MRCMAVLLPFLDALVFPCCMQAPEGSPPDVWSQLKAIADKVLRLVIGRDSA